MLTDILVPDQPGDVPRPLRRDTPLSDLQIATLITLAAAAGRDTPFTPPPAVEMQGDDDGFF